MNKVKESHGNVNSTVTKLTLWAIQIIIAISVLNFLKLAFFSDMADWGPGLVPFGITLLALITTFLMLCQYQRLIQEFTLQKAEEERSKLEAKMLEPQEPESLSVPSGGDLPPQKVSTC